MFSVEVVLLLYSMKINYPETFVMLRGNHETRTMTTYFNFRSEVLLKYDAQVYEVIMETFDTMPLGCVINDEYLAVHGGLSPQMRTLADINTIMRYSEPPQSGFFCDLLWSDPVDDATAKSHHTFVKNHNRGCSVFFDPSSTNKFLRENNLLSIIRAHEAKSDGYQLHQWNGPSEVPPVITIFSAPNYCDFLKNKGAYMKLKDGAINIQQFSATDHPYVLPEFMDVFQWSLPFVGEKVVDMLYQILKLTSDDTN